MVSVRLIVHHVGAVYPVDFNTADGIEILRFQIYSITGIPPERQMILGLGPSPVFPESDISSLTFRDGLKIVVQEHTGVPDPPRANGTTNSDEELAKKLQEEEDAKVAAMFQEEPLPTIRGSGSHPFQAKIEALASQVFSYEDVRKKAAAKLLVPIDELQERAAISLFRSGESEDDELAMKDAVLKQLLLWFKKSFFRWVDAPACHVCHSKTRCTGMIQPTMEDLRFEGNRVEQYNCTVCWATTRFVRYNDPEKLLETREGRCGEWANCFTLFCRSLGYEARHVVDWTDHVWTECYSEKLQRWVHLDPCEAAFDTPLLYEAGWGKNLNYVISFSVTEVRDVTRRYTRKWNEVLTRRTLISEEMVHSITARITDRLHCAQSSQVRAKLKERDRLELLELQSEQLPERAPPLAGRTTGSLEWRQSRGEIGSSASSSPAPAVSYSESRDAHVAKLMTALGIICGSGRDQIASSLSLCLKLIKALKQQPYKTRMLTMSAANLAVLVESNGFLLLQALGFRVASGAHEAVQKLDMAASPVVVAMALPLAEQLAVECRRRVVGGELAGGFVQLAVEGERASDGFVSADGENAPNELAVNLFDGSTDTKWLHRTGLKDGAWVVFRFQEGPPKTVFGYSLTSADDSPERDPRNWTLEGSADSGRSWTILDTKSGISFGSRHERKSFFIPASLSGNLCTAVRLRILPEPNSESGTLLQLCAFDLFLRPETEPTPEGVPQGEEAALLAALKPLTIQLSITGPQKEFQDRVEAIAAQVLAYEDPRRQFTAEVLVPLLDLEARAAIALQKSGGHLEDKAALKDAVLVELLDWFKSWFSWVDSPPCEVCHAPTRLTGKGELSQEDLQFDASHVEQYNCTACQALTRFVRYNDPEKLLKTRRGRNREWVTCFNLFCRALGYRTRFVADWTDRFWTECYSDKKKRWVHLDPCEALFDTPLLYESGWGKQLSFVIGFSSNGVRDVTRRYTRKWAEVATRRSDVSEDFAEMVTEKITARLRFHLSEAEKTKLKLQDEEEGQEFGSLHSLTASFRPVTSASPSPRKGRRPSMESASLAVPANDDTVSQLVSALGDMVRPLVTGEGDREAKAIITKSLALCHKTIVKLKSEQQHLLTSEEYSEMTAGNGVALLAAITPPGTIALSAGVNILPPRSMAGQLATTIPIAEQLIVETLLSLDGDQIPEPLALWAHGVRLSGGFIRVSGDDSSLAEQVAHLFDGLASTKWTARVGESGSAWAIYELPGGELRSAIGYSILPAKDYTEKDPAHWILQGSRDSGKSWLTLDEQNDVSFEPRNVRVAFRIGAANSVPCNSFRFKVISVRGAASTAQLCSLDIFVEQQKSDHHSRHSDLPGDQNLKSQSLLQEYVKKEFDSIMKEGGLSPNQAAVEALRRVKKKAMSG